MMSNWKEIIFSSFMKPEVVNSHHFQSDDHTKLFMERFFDNRDLIKEYLEKVRMTGNASSGFKDRMDFLLSRKPADIVHYDDICLMVTRY